MPLLSAEPHLYPPDLFERYECQRDDRSRWWVLHTRPRAEKCLARSFLRAGKPFFLPIYERRWRTRGQFLRSYLPLFPGYIFLFGDYPAWSEAKASRHVASGIVVADQEALHADLERLQRLIALATPLTPKPGLAPGTWVEVTSGPLTGLIGKIVRVGKRDRFLVEVQLIGQGVLADLEEYTMQPLAGLRSESVACLRDSIAGH